MLDTCSGLTCTNSHHRRCAVTGSEVAISSPVTVEVVTVDAAAVLADLAARAKDHERGSRAASTWHVYEVDWRMYVEWCATKGRSVIPVGGPGSAEYVSHTLRLYITDLDRQGRAAATITKKLSSISIGYAHAGVAAHRQIVWAESVTSVLDGIRRGQVDAGKRRNKKQALRTADLRKIVRWAGPPTIGDVRDRSLLLVLYAGAFRRSEVAALDLCDFVEVENGLEVTLRRSKTDKYGKELVKGLPYGSRLDTCPVRSWRGWLTKRGGEPGPAFVTLEPQGGLKREAGGSYRRMTGRAVAEVVKRRAEAAGLEGNWGGHSGRRGFATEAYANDSPEAEIMRQGGWNSLGVMRDYRDDAGVWKNNAAMKLDL